MADTKRIPLGSVKIPADTIRQDIDPDRLDELAASIKSLGLLQPIVVKKDGSKYLLLAGLRRTLAHRLLGERHILAYILPEDTELDTVRALVENIQRADLSLLDEAHAVRRLVDEFALGIPEAARRLGKGQEWVKSRLDILRLPESIVEPLRANRLPLGVALELNKIGNPEIRDTYVGYAVDGGCTTSQAVRWRQQLEADQAAGYYPPPGAGPGAVPYTPRNIRITCGICKGDSPLKTSQIVHVCASCYVEMARWEEENTNGGAGSGADAGEDRAAEERDPSPGVGDRRYGHPQPRYPGDRE